nr:hypothetical protein [Deltaproteobacteria bacterium]
MKAVYSLLIILFSTFVLNPAVAQNKAVNETKKEEKSEKSSFAALAKEKEKDKKSETVVTKPVHTDTSPKKNETEVDNDKTKLTDKQTKEAEDNSVSGPKTLSRNSIFPNINKNGNIGLRYTAAAAMAKPWTFYLGYGMDFFSWSDFIIADTNEKNSRFG